MPRKTKETNEAKTAKKQPKLNKKINELLKNVLDSEEKNAKTKKVTEKKTATKKAAKASAEKETKAKKASKTSDKKETKTTKKAVKSKEDKKDTKTTKTVKKPSKKSSKTDEKKVTKTTRKTITKKATKTVSKVATTKRISKPKTVAPTIVEYYDLPYKYNQTVVKVLYQNPTTLFVYWEISDDDIANYKATYGDNFFETTRPVLVVYNDTMNYKFEVNINDFANSWYFNINDSKCDYRIELIRRPIFYNEKIKSEYVFITSSNKIETPNDRILFSTNEQNVVYFRNIKSNIQRKVNLPKLIEQLNLANKDIAFPIVRNVYDLYKDVYHVDDIGEFSVDLTNNPSSRGGNPSSHSLSSRFSYSSNYFIQ